MKKYIQLLFLIYISTSCVGSSSVGIFGSGVSIAYDPRTVGMQIDDSIMQKNLDTRLAIREKKYLIYINTKVIDGNIFLSGKVDNPEDIVKVGEEIEVKILRVDTDERKIGLSRKRVEWAEEDEAADAESVTSASAASGAATSNLKGGLGQSGPLIATSPAAVTEEDQDQSAETEDDQSAETEDDQSAETEDSDEAENAANDASSADDEPAEKSDTEE